MQNTVLKSIAMAGVFFLFTACSNKSAITSSNQNPPQNQQARQPRGERPQFSDLLSQMDGNKDGKLAQSEIQGPLKNNFNDIDKNRDGFITEAEFKDAPAPPQRGRN